MLALAESIMERGESLSEEEERLLALTVLLIEAYEISNTTEDAPEEEDEEDGQEVKEDDQPPPAHIALQRLVVGYGMDLNDVAPIFGTPHLAQEAIEGKREITRRQAKELAKLFRVSPKLFASGE